MTLDLNTVKTVGIIVVGVLVLLAILASVIISKIIGKLIAVVILLGLAVAVYVERDNLQECLKTCQCTFFGIEVSIPDADLNEKCKQLVG